MTTTKAAAASDQSDDVRGGDSDGDVQNADGTPTQDVSATSGTAVEEVSDVDDVDAQPVELSNGRWFSWTKLVAFGILPIVALVFAAGAGYLKYRDSSLRDADAARTQSVHAATEGAVAMLSYGPDDVEAKLTAAQDRLTGPFRESYASLIKDVVIPGAKQQRIAATATVPAAASVSATGTHADVMVFVNQTIIMGNGTPTDTASAVDVTLEKVDSRWLISGFDPR